jgi:hypothetical protein
LSSENFKILKNSESANFDQIPILDFKDFRNLIIKKMSSDFRLSSLFVVPDKSFSNKDSSLRMIIILTMKDNIYLTSTKVDKSYDSLTNQIPQVHLFEREIWEQYGIKPEAHPFFKPVRFQGSDKEFSNKKDEIIGSTTFLKLKGDEPHEVAVGPVHAGVIEPGHFRFLCHGETVYNLEISLGYQHRGIENNLINGPNKKTIFYMETISGDATAAHTIAYSQAIEGLTNTKVSEKSLLIRGVLLELERIANHVGDLGALSGDVGYLPTNSFCGRIRGDFLNLTADICGNRFSRGAIKPGGVDYNIDENLSSELSTKIKKLMIDTEGAIKLLWNNNSVLARFEDTGIVTKKMCKELGLVGLVARSCNINQDIRNDLPFGIYAFTLFHDEKNSLSKTLLQKTIRVFSVHSRVIEILSKNRLFSLGV